jgi:hypothetical protein
MPFYSAAVAHWADDKPADKYGALLSTGGALPAGIIGVLPYHDGEQFQRDAEEIRNAACAMIYTRDDGPGGRVVLNRQVQAPIFPAGLP